MTGANSGRSDDDARAGAFVWPPRPMPPEPVDPNAPEALETAAEAPVAGAVAGAEVESKAVAAPPGRGSLDQARTWWGAVERVWLSPVALPLRERMAEARWAPDETGDYCNRCGETVGEHEADEFGCAACAGVSLPWSRFVRLGAHEDPLRAWIHEVKFTRWRALGVELGRVLGERLLDAGFGCERMCVVPVPTTMRRRLSRGVDHAGAIAQGVSEALGAPLVRALVRAHRPSQRSLAPTARRENVAGTMRAAGGVDLRGWRAALIDDVRTTGATLEAAARVLRPRRPNGPNRTRRPEIWACSLAVVTPKSRRGGVRTDGAGGS